MSASRLLVCHFVAVEKCPLRSLDSHRFINCPPYMAGNQTRALFTVFTIFKPWSGHCIGKVNKQYCPVMVVDFDS